MVKCICSVIYLLNLFSVLSCIDLLFYWVKVLYTSVVQSIIRVSFAQTIVKRKNHTIAPSGGSGSKGGKDSNKKRLKSKLEYSKVIVEKAFKNRDIISRLAKKEKGVYVFLTSEGEVLYVGHSISLYNRIISYFMPSILKTKARRVIRYFNKHGFTNVVLHVYIMKNPASLEQVIELEQSLIDTLKPILNVDLVAKGTGYHEPMRLEMREELRKQRGTPVYVYDAITSTLLFIFQSKQLMIDIVNIHRNTLNDCVHSGQMYLDTFLLSLEPIEEIVNINLLDVDSIKALIIEKRGIHITKKHPRPTAILAEFKDDPRLNREFGSLGSLSRALKGDRQIIRKYLKGKKAGYYRGK